MSTLLDRLLKRYYVCKGIYDPKAHKYVKCGARYSKEDIEKIPWSGWSNSASGTSYLHKHCPKCGNRLPV